MAGFSLGGKKCRAAAPALLKYFNYIKYLCKIFIGMRVALPGLSKIAL